MANADISHAVHLAKVAHHHREKHDKLIGKIKGAGERLLGTVEVGGGALLGGIIDGRTNGKTFLHVPLSLGAGVALIALAHTGYGTDVVGASHMNNLGNGFVANYLSSLGHAFGSNWKQNGFKSAFNLHGSGPAMPLPAPLPVDPTTMAAMAASMKQAAGVAY